MATLKVEVVKIDEIKEHSNADALEIAIVKGWQCVVKKGEFKSGDLCVYFPLDSVLPERLSDHIGITKYLAKGRVKAAKLRGEPSYGLLWPVDKAEDYIYPPPFDKRSFGEGMDLAEALGVTKWEPPVKLNIQDAETPHPLFDKYTEIENMRNYPGVIKPGEKVSITEKLHGSNCRFAYIDGEFMAGSHNVRLKESENNKYWHVFSDNIKKMLKHISNINNGAPVIAYGEVFGDKIQDLHYGHTNGRISYRCFDIKVDGKYLDYYKFVSNTILFGVDRVPVLFEGDFSMDEVMKFSKSKTFAGGDNIMEGVVVTPFIERYDERVGRVIMKYVFDQYLTRKGGTEYK